MAVWHDINTDTPPAPVQVELFCANLQFYDQNDEPMAPLIHPWRDMRRSMGYWDGEVFRDLASGYDLFEDWQVNDDAPPHYCPTHWRALPPPPEVERATLAAQDSATYYEAVTGP